MSYTTANFFRLDPTPNGGANIILRYTGNAGEPPLDFAYPQDLTTFPTADYIRSLAMARIQILNNNINFIAGATPFVGTNLDVTTPLPPPTPSTFGSFSAVSSPFTPGATPTDIFSITGSANRVVNILKMGIITIQTTAGLNLWNLIKRSTANSGGTSAAVTKVPANKTFPAGTATVLQYTANPATLGTLIGNVWSGRILAPTLTSIVTNPEKCVDLTGNIQPITLSGINDVLAWNFGGAALPAGLSVIAYVNWTEN